LEAGRQTGRKRQGDRERDCRQACRPGEHRQVLLGKAGVARPAGRASRPAGQGREGRARQAGHGRTRQAEGCNECRAEEDKVVRATQSRESGKVGQGNARKVGRVGRAKHPVRVRHGK
jgi:hypothetical protein